MSDNTKTLVYFVLLTVFVGLPLGYLIYSYGQLEHTPKTNKAPALTEQSTETTLTTDSISMYISLGLTHYQNGNYIESLTTWAKADVLSPNNPIILSNVASALIKIGQPKDAIPLLEKAIQLDPVAPLYKNNLKWAQDELAAQN
jgi:Flp pilus assembly protein TadD